MNVHIVSFPRWHDVLSCQRTVLHLPGRLAPNPMYRNGDLLVATNGSRDCVICRIIGVSTGSMMGFIGKVVNDTSAELKKVGVGFEDYKASFRRIHNAGIEAEKNTLRVEFGYEPIPLDSAVIEVLRPYARLRDDPISRFLDRQPQSIVEEEDMNCIEELDRACRALEKDTGSARTTSGGTEPSGSIRRGKKRK